MSNKYLALLLSPALIFLVIAAGELLLAQQATDHPNSAQEQQQFQSFVSNVQSGKWQLTADKWLVGMRSEHRLALAERGARLQLAQSMRHCVWYILMGIACQAIVVFSVRNEYRKQSGRT